MDTVECNFSQEGVRLMTFNNIEIPQHVVTPPTPNSYIFDGVDLAMLHDGLSRYVIIKNINTAVRLIEPNTSSSNYAHVIGDNISNVYVVNPGQRQVRILTASGSNIFENVVNLNDYNRLRDISIVGSNLTQNIFVPRGGGVSGDFVVVGGYIDNVGGAPTIGGEAIQTNALCYMYSDDSGGTWSGPWFPFVINTPTFAFLEGTVISTVLYQDNWYFQISELVGSQYTSKLISVGSLGVDLIGDEAPGSVIENLTADETVYQLPIAAHNNGIYTVDTVRNAFYFYDFETQATISTPFPGVNNITRVGSDLQITQDIDCTPSTISASVGTGANRVTVLDIGGIPFNMNIGVGKILIDDDQGAGITPAMLGVPVESDHFLQPSYITQ